jgi:hypothetical protein
MLRGRDDLESRRLYAVAAGVETSLATFCVGGAFLSLETFELPYLLFLMGWKAADVMTEQTCRESYLPKKIQWPFQ